MKIVPSPISGLGTFADRDYQAGEVVLPWVIEKELPPERLGEFSEEEREFVSQNEAGNYVLFAEYCRRVNHSCDPNTIAKGNANVAMRDIKKGEEVTTDYELEGALNAFDCHCGSEKCRGRIGL